MKRTLKLLMIPIAILGATSLNTNAAQDGPPCPNLELGESQLDCPWATVSRLLQASSEGITTKAQILEQTLPEFTRKIRSDAENPMLAQFWGTSINFDEHALAQIVDESILSVLEKFLGVSIREPNQILPNRELVRAGYEHTYGYIFSTLQTPYGFKRARWVGGEAERGFGLPPGTFGPVPQDGTLLSNVTYFSGNIVFRKDPIRLAELKAVLPEVSPSLIHFQYSSLKVTRVVETVTASTQSKITRSVKIITDFVPFQKPSPDMPDSVLLIYWVLDGLDQIPRLITAFPVNQAAMDSAIASDALGEGKVITTHNNGFIDGVTGLNLLGTRTLE